MAIEDELRERLRKVEALFFGATTAGEREAASAAAERLKAKLAEASRLDPPVETVADRPDLQPALQLPPPSFDDLQAQVELRHLDDG